MNKAPMKKLILTILVAMMAAVGAEAQTSLVGREYHNPNIMSGMLKDVDKLVAQKKAEALKKAEEKKGRKLTEEEMKKFNEEMKELEAKIKAIKSGTSMAMTVTFKTDKTAVVKAKAKVSDEAMKAAGIGWLKRKAMKAAMAVMPAQDMPYTVKGDMIILQDDKDRDTLRLSADGKSLSGKNDGVVYTLKRTK